MIVHSHITDNFSGPFKYASTETLVESPASLSAWNLLGKRWTFLIIARLLARPHCFSELVEHVQGIAESVLSERLKELEHEGVVRRRAHDERPFRVTYHLTQKGEALEPVIRSIYLWSQHL